MLSSAQVHLFATAQSPPVRPVRAGRGVNTRASCGAGTSLIPSIFQWPIPSSTRSRSPWIEFARRSQPLRVHKVQTAFSTAGGRLQLSRRWAGHPLRPTDGEHRIGPSAADDIRDELLRHLGRLHREGVELASWPATPQPRRRSRRSPTRGSRCAFARSPEVEAARRLLLGDHVVQPSKYRARGPVSSSRLRAHQGQ